MKNQMTSRDYELITAYLDNQLSSKERAQFETRLKSEPLLQKELQDIGKTRLLVRSMPKLRAPRNYFVTSKMIPEAKSRGFPVPRGLRLAPEMGIVSAIATLLLVLVIFGDRLLTSTTPVALAPAAQVARATQVVQERAQSKEAPTEVPTEAAPMIMMGAPALTPAPPSSEVVVGETEVPTPTTIILFASPPTPTLEERKTITDQETESTIIACEQYLGSGAYPTAPGSYNCPTPTSTGVSLLQSISATSTPTASVTSTLTPTATTTPTDTPSPSPTPAITPTEIPAQALEVAPTEAAVAPSDITVQNQGQVSTGTTPTSEQPTVISRPTPDVSFVRYIVLAIEVSLALIAVVAGIAAIVLRIRAGR